MIELVLAYYLVLGVIKLCLWGKRGVKIYLVTKKKMKEKTGLSIRGGTRYFYPLPLQKVVFDTS
jgi:hypothetical protein